VSSKLKFSKIRAVLDRIPDSMKGIEAKVGYHEGVAYEDGTPVAYVATIMEYGAPGQGIPARPTMGPTLDKNHSHYTDQLAKGTKSVLNGKLSGEQVIGMVGEECAGDIRKAISEFSGKELSPITVMLRGMKHNNPDLKVSGKIVGEAAERVKDGKTNYGASTKPLVDTGLMLNSCTSEVGKK